jgi:hypothetical protein
MGVAILLYARSGRWIAPAVLLMTWVALVVANPGSALDNAANLFFVVLIVAVWWTSGIGNVDDDPHRDLCAASVGGPEPLAMARNSGALFVLLPVVVVVGVLGIISGPRDGASWPTVIVGTASLLMSGAMLGVAIGSLLHRPVVRSMAWTVLLALVAILLVVLLPPVRDVLRGVDHAHVGGVGGLLVASFAVLVVAWWAAMVLAARRS